jgi:SAM-dependent methyltransferase
MTRVGPLPPHVSCLEGDFLKLRLDVGAFDVVIATDVFEHIAVECEKDFADKCYACLRPGGHLIVSVPHAGRYSFLDPYNVKPRLQRLLFGLGLYSRIHNGECDLRKGHRHFCVGELIQKFSSFEVVTMRRWGLFYDPLSVLASAVFRRTNYPLSRLLEPRLMAEARECGEAAYNMAVKFRKPVITCQ